MTPEALQCVRVIKGRHNEHARHRTVKTRKDSFTHAVLQALKMALGQICIGGDPSTGDGTASEGG